jgi:uncharacterized protein involved in exopolysaccharide biosynthesis
VIMNRDVESAARNESIGFFEIMSILWNRKWLIAVVAALAVGLSLVYVFTAKQWFRADVLLKPTDSKTSLTGVGQLGSLGGLGGLASLAGINLGSGNSAEAMAVLVSREFTAAFLEDQNIVPLLYSNRWDAVQGRWKPSAFFDPPDIRDATQRFNKSIRSVQEDRKTGFVTMSIEWTDPKIAADWANLLVERLNERMRSKALVEAETNVAYLKQEIASSNVVPMQQSIGRVLEAELQRLMLAKATHEYSFKIIDHAIPPRRHSWPRGIIVAPIALLLGVAAAVFYVLAQDAISRKRVADLALQQLNA